MSEEEGEDEVNTKKTPVKAKENKKKKKVRIILTSSLFFNLTTFFFQGIFLHKNTKRWGVILAKGKLF